MYMNLYRKARNEHVGKRRRRPHVLSFVLGAVKWGPSKWVAGQASMHRPGLSTAAPEFNIGPGSEAALPPTCFVSMLVYLLVGPKPGLLEGVPIPPGLEIYTASKA